MVVETDVSPITEIHGIIYEKIKIKFKNMKKKLLALGASLALCIPMMALDYVTTNMVVKQKNGEKWMINVEDVEEVVYERIYIKDPSVVDTSDTPLKFKILTDSTVEVVKDNSYRAASFPDSIKIPSKIRIDSTVYTVTSIGYEAFRECKGLSSIEIPESITKIDNWALYDCTGLEPRILVYNNGTKCYGWVGDRTNCTTIEIPTGVKEIGAAAFYSLKNLTSVTIPNTVISLGTSAFSECSSLTKIEIPESVTQINYGFYNCKKLDVIIHNSEENVNIDKSFYKDVKSVTFLDPQISTSDLFKFEVLTDSTVEIIKDASYKAASFPDSIEIPSKVRIGNTIYTVTSIGYEAFRECSNLSYVKIPESIKSIDTWAFFDCTGLAPEVLIYDNGTKCYGWVGDRSKCTTIEIPEGVKEIGAGAFYKCTNMTNITFPNTLKFVGTSAFSECTGLKTIEFPESVTQINYGFYNCKNLDVIINNSEENMTIDTSFYKEVKSVVFAIKK
jgi:hypothetical protein